MVVLKLELHGASVDQIRPCSPASDLKMKAFWCAIRHIQSCASDDILAMSGSEMGGAPAAWVGSRFGGSPQNVTIKSLVDSPSGTLQTRLT